MTLVSVRYSRACCSAASPTCRAYSAYSASILASDGVVHCRGTTVTTAIASPRAWASLRPRSSAPRPPRCGMYPTTTVTTAPPSTSPSARVPAPVQHVEDQEHRHPTREDQPRVPVQAGQDVGTGQDGQDRRDREAGHLEGARQVRLPVPQDDHAERDDDERGEGADRHDVHQVVQRDERRRGSRPRSPR